MSAPQKHLGLWSGVGLVAGSMIGAGVFVSAGFMAQSLSAGWILLSWVIGAAIAAVGAVAYGELARLIPRSGGEYRYLSELVHPLVGTLAGWSSLLFGFSAPLAINALGAAAFSATLFPSLDERFVAALFIALPTASHAISNRTSRWVQNSLAAAKVLLVVGFALLGVFFGEVHWPSWSPPSSTGFSLSAFMTGLFFVGFANSGWNSSVYAASEFRDAERDVPRSMLLGLGLVTILYLVVNWVFVANLTPAQAAAVTDGSAATLGHLIAVDLLGSHGANVMSVVVVLAFVSAISAITVIGPRVYAEMAEDGVLPGVLRYHPNGSRPPTGAVLFQGAVAIALLLVHSLRDVLVNASAILLLFTAIAAVGLVRLALSRSLRKAIGRPRAIAVACASIYALVSTWMLAFGFREQPSMLLWIGGAAALTVGTYVFVGNRRYGNRR